MAGRSQTRIHDYATLHVQWPKAASRNIDWRPVDWKTLNSQGGPLSCRRRLFHSNCSMGSNKKNGMDHAVDAQITASQRVEGEHSWFPLMRTSRARVKKPLEQGWKATGQFDERNLTVDVHVFTWNFVAFFVSRFVSESSFSFLGSQSKVYPIRKYSGNVSASCAREQKVTDPLLKVLWSMLCLSVLFYR